jgi:phage shock protein C
MTNAEPSTPSNDQPAWQQLPPSGSPARPQLRRSSTDRMIGGVAGGLAEYSGIDSVLWRVGLVALTLAGGAGIVIYLLLWVLMPSGPPRAGEQPSPLEQSVQRLHTRVSGSRFMPPQG